MRKKQRRTSEEAAWDLLRTASVVHLGTTTREGAPLVRPLNAVVRGGHVLFHGAIFGEKSGCLGRQAVVSAYREIADVPSYFTDAEKACPATTYYRSAQAFGELVDVTDTTLRAEMLEELMQKYQPEGGYVPLRPDEPLYAKDYRSVRVFGVAIERIDGKANLGQEKPEAFARAIVEGLWKRGKQGDPDAIREILEESPHPWPEKFRGPRSTEFLVAPRADELDQAAALLVNQYWRGKTTRASIRESLARSSVWIGARDESGQIVATARALTDTAWVSSIHDVAVREDHRGAGLGRRLVELLLDHPGLRGTRHVHLGTRDRQSFYEHFGFREAATLERAFASTPMTLVRKANE